MEAAEMPLEINPFAFLYSALQKKLSAGLEDPGVPDVGGMSRGPTGWSKGKLHEE